MDVTGFRSFLNLFQYGIDNCKKKEAITYIMERMQEATEKNKVLKFDKLADIEFSPNPCLDRSGELYFDTRKLQELYEAYKQGIKYINTEVANLEREKFLAMHDIAKKPFVEIHEYDETDENAKGGK